ncbi:hypothetical protein BYT27DRAFT_7098668 [Phlegmacium glaucopus]|nr:hypothetical protein BYT27DRAFT_7098668 [Phlegmacium glaucopus]
MYSQNLREVVFGEYRDVIFPSLLTLSSTLAFRPNSSITPIIFTLTLLLVYSRFLFRSEQKFGASHIVLLCALAVGASLSKLQASFSALSTPAPSIIVLFLSALVLSFFTLSILYVDTKFCTRFNSSWAQVTLFPALWATLWCTISYISPVGHLSTWSAAEHTDAYNWIVPIAGPASKDWITAAWAVVMSQIVGAWYMGYQDHDEDSLLGNQPRRQQFGGSHSRVGILALCLTFATIPSFLILQLPLPVSDINISTPLTVGCVLPPLQKYKHHVLTLDDFIRESATVKDLAHIILWPEGAVAFNSTSARDEGLKLVRDSLPGRAYIGVSFEETVDDPSDSTSKTPLRRTGVAVISQYSLEPHHLYYKRNLVPFAESFSLRHSLIPPSIFELELKAPKGKKIEWGPAPDHTRSIPLTSSICLDFASPSPFADLPSRPGLILAPARTWEKTVGYAMWLQARQRAEELQSIVLWCDGGEGGVSGVGGSGFNDVFQVGSGSFVRTIGIQYPFNYQKTSFARWGDSVLILFWLLLFVPGRIPIPTFMNIAPVSYVQDKIRRAGEYLWQRTNRADQNPTRAEPPTGNLLD